MSSSKRPTGGSKRQGAPNTQGQDRRQAGRGRRRTDQPRSMVATIGIAASFLFSGGLMLWSFSQPFRTGALGQNASTADAPVAQRVRLEYEAQLTNEQYLDYAQDLDRQVFDAIRDQEFSRLEVARELNEFERERRRERMAENRLEQLEKMKSGLEEGEKFLKGTIQWEYEQELEKFLNDTDG
ncbi:MAG: hypothetical protein AAFU85_20385 [Planctomycetota bacterium]